MIDTTERQRSNRDRVIRNVEKRKRTERYERDRVTREGTEREKENKMIRGR